MRLRSRFSHGVARIIGILAGAGFLLLEGYLCLFLERHTSFVVFGRGAGWLVAFWVVPWFVYQVAWAWCSALGPCPGGCGRIVSCKAAHCLGCGAPVAGRR